MKKIPICILLLYTLYSAITKTKSPMTLVMMLISVVVIFAPFFVSHVTTIVLMLCIL